MIKEENKHSAGVMRAAKDAPQFEDISQAFNYCREKDHPVIVILDDTAQGYYGTYKLYPSGRAEQLLRCICMSVENHTVCPTHGMEQFVDWGAEQRVAKAEDSQAEIGNLRAQHTRLVDALKEMNASFVCRNRRQAKAMTETQQLLRELGEL